MASYALVIDKFRVHLEFWKKIPSPINCSVNKNETDRVHFSSVNLHRPCPGCSELHRGLVEARSLSSVVAAPQKPFKYPSLLIPLSTADLT